MFCFAKGEDKHFLNVFSCGELYNPDIVKRTKMLLSRWFAVFLGLVASVVGSIVRINALGDSITGSPVCSLSLKLLACTSARPIPRVQ